MVYQEGQYSDEVFRNIPFARDAFGYVDEHPMPEEAIDDLRAVFLNHKQEHALGLSILHRHFDIQPHEKVVEYENVATPWTVPSYLPLLRGKIASRSWAFIDNILYPYEFLYVPDQALKSYAPNLPELDEDFVHELRDVLTKHQLEKVYGLALLPADAQDESAPSRLEFTAGRANVTVPMTEEMYETATIATGYLFPCIDPLLPGGYRGPKMRHCWTCVRH